MKGQLSMLLEGQVITGKAAMLCVTLLQWLPVCGQQDIVMMDQKYDKFLIMINFKNYEHVEKQRCPCVRSACNLLLRAGYQTIPLILKGNCSS